MVLQVKHPKIKISTPRATHSGFLNERRKKSTILLKKGGILHDS